MCLLGPALPLPALPPRRCCCTPRGSVTPGCKAQVTPLAAVSSSVNRGALRALAQRGPELSLEHRESAEPTQKVLLRGSGEARGCPPCAAPPPEPKHKLSFTLRSDVPSPVLPPQPPPRWNFKHSNPSGHLSAPKFSEEVEVCELQGHSSRCPSLHALSPACAPWQLVAVPPVQLKTLSPSSVLVPGPAAHATGASRAHLLLEDALWFAASLGRQAGAV